jgi:hypothetical protein
MSQNENVQHTTNTYRLPVRSRSRILAAVRAAAWFGVLVLAWGSGPAVPPAEGQDPASRPATKPVPSPQGKAVPTARELLGPPASVPLTEQLPAKIIVDPPLPDQLAKGVVVIQFRTENLRLSPVFGREALAVSPRIGHLHVYVDDAPWLWAHVSSEELIINGLPPGPHQVRIDLVNSNHQPLAKEVVRFEVPRRPPTVARVNHGPAGGAPVGEQPPAKLIVEPPQPDLLARGVAYIRFRAENVQIAPVFGPAALAVSPRIAHLQVTVDDAPWHWTDASGHPVDVGRLPPGPHRIRFALVDANGQPLAQHVVNADVP